MRQFYIAGIILLFSGIAFAGTHKLRLSGTGGYDMIKNAGSGEIKIAMAYPITPQTHVFNVELGIVSGYSRHFIDEVLSRVSFGFGIRVFLNAFEGVRPYFTHEVLSGIISKSNATGTAKTFSVLLGLGADFPISENSSLFADVSYLFYDTDYFETKGDRVKTVGLTAGYAFGF